METEISAETLIPISQTIRYHREGYSTNLQRRGGIKQQTLDLKPRDRKLRELTFFCLINEFWQPITLYFGLWGVKDGCK
jgi:hypothetical protein